MQSKTFSFGKWAKIFLSGPSKQIEDLRLMACWQGADAKKICVIKAPSNPTGIGYQFITDKPVYGISKNPVTPDVFAEGVMLTENGSAAIIRTADCPTLVLFESTSGRLLMTHAGRAAMTPTNPTGEPVSNIVTKAYSLLTKDRPSPHVLAYITGSICPDCFPHEDETGQRLIAPFNQFPGSVAIKDTQRGSLDLPTLITCQLIRLGVSANAIWHDGVCTYETPGLASFRRDKTDARNAVFVIKL